MATLGDTLQISFLMHIAILKHDESRFLRNDARLGSSLRVDPTDLNCIIEEKKPISFWRRKSAKNGLELP